MPGYPEIQDQAFLASLAETRRFFHRMPELSWTEYWTTAQICAELASLGYQVSWGAELYGEHAPSNPPDGAIDAAAYRRAEELLGANNPYLPTMRGGRTGLVATLEGGAPGPTYGYRFDIDALPIQESADEDHIPARLGFRSQNPGVMHACGHDGHITLGLGLARRLAADRGRIHGNVRLFFQPAEEVGGGGKIFAKLSQLLEVDRMIAVHVGILGKEMIVTDPNWLAIKAYDVEMIGRAAHAANSPEQGCDALKAACQAALGLYSIARHSGGISFVNVGEFHSGNATNVIADRVTFRYEVRGGDNAICDHMAGAAVQVLEGAARMCGVEYTQKLYGQTDAYPNSQALAQEAAQAAVRLGMSPDSVVCSHRIMGSEDANYLINAVNGRGGKATYLIFGCPLPAGHHNPKFDFDERVMAWGVELLRALAGLEAGPKS